MSPKHQRMRFLLISLALMAMAATFILRNFQDSLVFFFTPTQWQEKHAGLDPTRLLRIGGLVKMGSVQKTKTGVRFIITDLETEISVTYSGLLPALFREGQGVVAEGTIDASGKMTATTILAKHDENYMPKEVVEQLKASGRWKEYGNFSGASGAGGASAPATAPPRSLRSGSLLNAATHEPSQGSK